MGYMKKIILFILALLIIPYIIYSTEYIIRGELNLDNMKKQCKIDAELIEKEDNTTIINLIHYYNSLENISDGICVKNDKIACISKPVPVIIRLFINETSNISIIGNIPYSLRETSYYFVFQIDFVPKEVLYIENYSVLCKNDVKICIKDNYCNRECSFDADCFKVENTTLPIQPPQNYTEIRERAMQKYFEKNSWTSIFIIAGIIISVAIVIIIWIFSK